MFKKKNKQIKISSNKSNLDQVLWFIENYLPQKKDRGVQKKLYMDNLEAAVSYTHLTLPTSDLV